MILRQAFQTAGPEQIRARVTDVDDEQVAAAAASGGQRRSHAVQRSVLTSAIDEHRPDLLNGLTRAALDLGRVFRVHPEDPVRNLQGQADERADGQPARDLTGGVAAHPIGNHHHVVDFVRSLGHVAGGETRLHRLQRARRSGDEKVILVVRPHVARMRQAADIDSDR